MPNARLQRTRDAYGDELKDMVQHLWNAHPLPCTWRSAEPRTSEHRRECMSCRVVDALTPGWYLKPVPPFSPRTPLESEPLKAKAGWSNWVNRD